ncbi:MAG TPA: putative metal-dependent hydrolase [Thermoanaerobaculia bacterium]|nr:putative metal-dependent hydrolase [Thermoanaerobaculia bacterium]
MIDLQYPIGKFESRTSLTPEERGAMIAQISAAPQWLRDAVRGLDSQQLGTPYREGGWTLRQVVHHLPDSHMNAYVRLKLALTEHEPVIRPYDQAAWAALPDSRDTPVETSLNLFEALHDRWSRLLRSLDEKAFARPFRHPEEGVVTVDWLVAMYSWHGRHHVAQITTLRQRLGW